MWIQWWNYIHISKVFSNLPFSAFGTFWFFDPGMWKQEQKLNSMDKTETGIKTYSATAIIVQSAKYFNCLQEKKLMLCNNNKKKYL